MTAIAKDKTLYEGHDSFYAAIQKVNQVWKTIKSRLHVDTDGCWVYSGCTNQNGYGRFSYKIKSGGKYKVVTVGVHKFVYRYFIGPVGEYELLRHTCNKRDCCNPAHLLTGSFLDNVKDRMNKGVS